MHFENIEPIINQGFNVTQHRRMRFLRTYLTWVRMKWDGFSTVHDVEQAWLEYTEARDFYFGFAADLN